MKTIKLLFYSLFLVPIAVGISSSFSYGQTWCWGAYGEVNIKSDDYCSPVATNRYGNAYITGQFENLIIFGKDTLKDAHDNTFIVKYNPNGVVLWAHNPSTSGSETSFGYAVVSDAEDNAYITGTGGLMVFGKDTLNTGFFVKYSPTG